MVVEQTRQCQTALCGCQLVTCMLKLGGSSGSIDLQSRSCTNNYSNAQKVMHASQRPFTTLEVQNATPRRQHFASFLMLCWVMKPPEPQATSACSAAAAAAARATSCCAWCRAGLSDRHVAVAASRLCTGSRRVSTTQESTSQSGSSPCEMQPK